MTNSNSNNKSMLLMMKDIPVMSINFDIGLFEVLNEQYLPFIMKNKLRSWVYTDKYSAQYNATQMYLAADACKTAFITFLAHRVLPLDRENAKKILNLLHLTQMQDEISKAKIAITCRAVSLQDNYWLKLEGDNTTWSSISIRANRLSNIVAQVALHGKSLTLQGKMVSTPELTTHGAYAKCWKREEGKLYLYKKGFRGNAESKIEVEVSNILDKCSVNHLKYTAAEDGGHYCCKCECMTTDDISILSGGEFISYCNRANIDWFKYIMTLDPITMLQMLVVDYLISNPDRHGMNWGLWYNCNTMELISCHPLYDHNNAFDREVMQDQTGGNSLILEGKTQKEAAQWALKQLRSRGIEFVCNIKPEDFTFKSHYESFIRRMRSLGLSA